MPDSPDRGVYVVLSNNKGLAVKFYMPEEIPHGYTNKLDPKAGEHRTHPQMHLWKGGSIDDIPLTVKLMVGMPGVPTPEHLQRLVETLQDMALPPGTYDEGVWWLEAITMSVGRMGGEAWYQRRVFIKNLKSIFVAEPVDVNTGRCLQCKLSMTLVPTYTTESSFVPADRAILPRRPYRLSRG